MAVKYMLGSSLATGRPHWGICAQDADPADFRFVGQGEDLGEDIRRYHEERSIEYSLESLARAISGSYTATSDWQDSDKDLDGAAENVRLVLANANAIPYERASQLAEARRGLVRTGAAGRAGAMAPQQAKQVLEEAGLAERFARPGMGYPVPDDPAAVLAQLLGGDAEGGAQAKAESEPEPEESPPEQLAAEELPTTESARGEPEKELSVDPVEES